MNEDVLGDTGKGVGCRGMKWLSSFQGSNDVREERVTKTTKGEQQKEEEKDNEPSVTSIRHTLGAQMSPTTTDTKGADAHTSTRTYDFGGNPPRQIERGLSTTAKDGGQLKYH